MHCMQPQLFAFGSKVAQFWKGWTALAYRFMRRELWGDFSPYSLVRTLIIFTVAIQYWQIPDYDIYYKELCYQDFHQWEDNSCARNPTTIYIYWELCYQDFHQWEDNSWYYWRLLTITIDLGHKGMRCTYLSISISCLYLYLCLNLCLCWTVQMALCEDLVVIGLIVVYVILGHIYILHEKACESKVTKVT